MVARRRPLPDLPAQFRRCQWRRRRRPRGHHREASLRGRLGVDGIWLSPFFPSPMRDFGYDVSDHLGVDPMFGTEQDFDAAVAGAPTGPEGDHRPGVEPHRRRAPVVRGKPREPRQPQGRLVRVGRCPARRQPAQQLAELDGRAGVALGAATPAIPSAQLPAADAGPEFPLRRRCRTRCSRSRDHWLDRGVDGFRLDTANLYFHSRGLAGQSAAAAGISAAIPPVLMQAHQHNADQPEAPLFFERLRALMDRYPDRMAVAEIGGAGSAAHDAWTTRAAVRGCTPPTPSRSWASGPTRQAVMAALAPWNEGDGASAWPSWAFSNHDAPRVATRWAGCAAGAFAFGGQASASTQASVAIAGDLAGPAACAARHGLPVPGRRAWPAAKHAGFEQTCAIRSASPTGR